MSIIDDDKKKTLEQNKSDSDKELSKSELDNLLDSFKDFVREDEAKFESDSKMVAGDFYNREEPIYINVEDNHLMAKINKNKKTDTKVSRMNDIDWSEIKEKIDSDDGEDQTEEIVVVKKQAKEKIKQDPKESESEKDDEDEDDWEFDESLLDSNLFNIFDDSEYEKIQKKSNSASKKSTKKPTAKKKAKATTTKKAKSTTTKKQVSKNISTDVKEKKIAKADKPKKSRSKTAHLDLPKTGSIIYIKLEDIDKVSWQDVVVRKGRFAYHMTPTASGGWFIKKAGNAGPSAYVADKEEALQLAQKYAKREKSTLKVHNKKGTIEQSFSFGHTTKK